MDFRFELTICIPKGEKITKIREQNDKNKNS